MSKKNSNVTQQVPEFDPFKLVPPEKLDSIYKASEEERTLKNKARSTTTTTNFPKYVVDKLGEDFRPYNGVESVFKLYEKAKQKENDDKAAAQSYAGIAFKGLGRILTSATLEIAKIPGYIGGLTEAAFTDATIGEAMDNAWINTVESMDEGVKENFLKIYTPTDVKEGNLWDKMTSASWWSTTGADGISTVLGFAGGGAIFKTLGLGSRILGKASKLGAKVDDASQVLFSSTMEASAEAHESFNSIYTQLQPKIESGELSDKEARELAGEQASKVFGVNMLLLGVSNTFDQKWLFGGFRNESKEAIKAAKKALDGTAETSVKFYKKIPSAVGTIGKGFIKEGFFEEGMQFATQKYFENRATNKEEDTNWFTGILGTYANSLSDADFQESVFLGGVLGSPMGVYGKAQEKKNMRDYIYGSPENSPSAIQRFFGKRAQSAKKGLVTLLQENYATSYIDMTDIWKTDENGKQILKDGKPEIDNSKRAAILETLAKKDKLNADIVEALGREDTVSHKLLSDFAKLNFMTPYFEIEGGEEIFNAHLDKIAKAEVDKAKAVENKDINFESVKGEIKQQFTSFKEIHDKINNPRLKTIKLSEKTKKENPFFLNILRGTFMSNHIYQKNLAAQISDLDSKISTEEGQDTVESNLYASVYKEQKKVLEAIQSKIKEKAATLLTKEGQEKELARFKEDNKQAVQDLQESEEEEGIEEDASQIQNFDHAKLYKEQTVVKDGKKHHGGIKITLEGGATKNLDIVGFNNGELEVRDAKGKTSTISEEGIYDFQQITKIDKTYAPRVKSTVVSEPTTSEDNPEEDYENNPKKNFENEPHAPFTGSFTDFFRTKGNQENFEQDPVKYKPLLEFYKFIDNYDVSIPETSTNYRNLTAYTLKTLPKQVLDTLPKTLLADIKKYPSSILLFVTYKNAFATQNGSYMFSYMPEPLLNGNVEPVNREANFPLFSYNKYRETHVGLSDEQITQDVQKAAEAFTKIREKILTSVEPITFKIHSRNKGSLIKEDNTIPSSVVGKIVAREEQIKDVDLFISTDDRDKGLAFINHKGVKLPVTRTTLSETDIKRVVGLMQFYVQQTDATEKQKAHRAISSFIHLVYQSKGIENPSKFTFFPIEKKVGENQYEVIGFQYGEYTISKEDLLDGSTEHLEQKFLINKYYSIDKSLLEESNNKKDYIEYTYKEGALKETVHKGKFGGYKKFLLSGDNPRVLVTIRPLSETQFLNRSFNIEPINSAIAPMTKEEINTVVEENKTIITETENFETPPTTSSEEPLEDPEGLYKISKPSDIIGTSIKEMKDFRKMFPNFDLRFIPNGLINGIGVAAVTANMEVLVTQYTTLGALYHESFHIISQFFTTPATRSRLYNEVRNRVGKEMTDLQAEEFLADEFQLFMQNPKTYKFNKGEEAKQNFFQRLWSAIKSFFGVSSIEDMFEKASKSTYNKADVINKPSDFKYLYKIAELDETASRKLLDHYNVLFFDRISNTAEFKAEALLNLTPEKVDQVYDLVDKALSKSTVPSFANKMVIQYTEELKKEHKKYLKQYGFTGSILNIEDDQKLTKDNSQFVESITRDLKEDIPSPIKLLVASLTQRNKVDGTIYKDNQGFTKKVDFDATLNTLYRELANVPESKMFEKLFKLSETTHPEFKTLLSRLGITLDQQIPDNASKDLVNLQTMFIVEFKKNMQNVKMGILNKESIIYFTEPTQETRESKVIAKWMSDIKVGENPYFDFKNGKHVLNKKELYTLPSGKQVEITKVHLEGNMDKVFPRYSDVQDYLKNFGITFYGQDFSKSTNTARKIIRFLSDNLDNADNPTADDIFNKNIGKINKEIKELAEEEVIYSRNNISNQYLNGKGQSEHALGLNNKFTNTITDLNNGIVDNFIPYSEENPDGNLQTAFSNWDLPSLKSALLRSAKPDFEDAIDIDQTKKGDFVVSEINSVLLGNAPFLRAADRSLEYLIDTGKPSSQDYSVSEDRFVTTLKDYLENEIIVALAYQNNPNAKYLVKSGKANTGLQFFKSLLPNLDVKREATKNNYQKVAQEIIKDNLSTINIALSKFVKDVTEENRNILLENSLIENVGTHYTNNGISKDIITEFTKESTLSDKDINQIARTFSYLYTINGLEQVKYFMGSLGIYKKGNTDDFHKRTTTVVSTKKDTRNSQEFVDYLNKAEPRLDGWQHTTNFRDFVYSDVEVSSYLNEELKKLGINDYDKMTENDAQGWASLDGYKSLLNRTGEWSTNAEQTYQYEMQSFVYENIYNNDELLNKTKLSKERIDELFKEHLPEGWKGIPQFKGKDINVEDLESLPILKPQSVGQLQNKNIKTFGANQITKTSLAPLLPSNLINSVGIDLAIDMFVNGLDFVFPKSAKKGEMLGNLDGELAPLYNEDGSINTISEAINQGHLVEEISWSDIGIQLDIDPSGKTKVTQSTQMEALKSVDIYDKGNVVPGYEKLAYLVNEDKRLKDTRKEKLLESLRQELGLIKEDNKYRLEDPTKFYNALEKEFTRKTYSDNILQGIKLVLESDLTNFDTLNVSDKIDNLLTSLISNNLVKQKVKGDMMIQQASTLYESSKRNTKSSNFLKTYELKDGKVTPAECMISLPKEWIKIVNKREGKNFSEKLANFNKEIKNSSWDELLTMASNRIPTQHLNSMEAMRVVGFLNPWSGSTIIVPSEIVVKAGSDFDVDKLTKYLNAYRFNSADNPVFLNEGTVEQRYVQYIKEKFFKVDDATVDKKGTLEMYEAKVNEQMEFLLKTKSYKDLSPERIKELRIEEKSIALEPLADKFKFMSFDEFSKQPLEKQLSIEQIDNKINKNSIEYILDPLNYKALMSPNGSGSITTEADKIKPPKKVTELTDLLKFKTNMDYGFAQWKAMSVLGTAANNTTFHAKVQKAPIRINKELIKISFKDASDTMGSKFNTKGDLISIRKGEYVSAAVDAAKESEPALTRANITPSTGNLVMFLNELQVPEKDIFEFITHPSILKYETQREIFEAKFLQVQNLSKYKSDIVESVIGYNKKQQKKMLHNLFTSIIENKGTTVEDLNTRWTEKFSEGLPTNENDVLEYFLYLTEVAKQYGELVQLTKQDAGMPKTRDTVTNREERLNKLIGLRLFSPRDIRNLFDNTYLGGFREMQNEGVKMFDSFFTRTSNERFSSFIFEMMQPYKEAKVPEDKLMAIQRKLTKKTLSYLLHTQEVNSIKLIDKYNDLLFSKNNIANRILTLKNSNKEIKDNLFIQELIPIVSEFIDRRQENLSFDYIRRFSSKITTFEEDSLNQSFKELMDNQDPDIKQLATDIIYVSIIQSGLTKSNSSFFDTIPVEYFYPIASEAITSFQESDFNFLNKEAMKTILQNSWMDKDLVKKQNAFVNGESILKDNNTRFTLKQNFSNAQYSFLTVELTDKESKAKTQYLFERQPKAEDSNTVTYIKVDKKGEGNKFFEATLSTEPSLIKSNNAPLTDISIVNNNESDEFNELPLEIEEEVVPLVITEEQLQSINDNLTKAGYKNITMKEFNNMSLDRQKKAIECYG